MKPTKLNLIQLHKVVFIIAIIILAIVQNQLANKINFSNEKFNQQNSLFGTKINPKIIKRLLGIRLMVADLIWIDTLIKADITHEPNPFTNVFVSFKNMTELDSKNIYAYYVGGLYLSVIKDDVKGASTLMRNGLQNSEWQQSKWRGRWQLPYTLGFNLLFEEHEVDEGSYWIRIAAQDEFAPDLVKRIASRLETESGRLEMASRILQDFYKKLTREDEKEQVKKKIIQLAVKQELATLNERFSQFLSATEANHLARSRQFDAFMRAIHHSRQDLLGRPLKINDLGKIVSLE